MKNCKLVFTHLFCLLVALIIPNDTTWLPENTSFAGSDNVAMSGDVTLQFSFEKINH